MSIVMRLLSWADGRPLNSAGRFVKTLDVQAAPVDPDWLTTTTDIAEAMHWPDEGAAFLAWKEILHSDPVRPDGKLNRPMTALNVEFVRVQQ